MTTGELIRLKFDYARLAVAEAILRFFKVPDAIAAILDDGLRSLIALEVENVIPLTRMAELEGRIAQVIDDCESLKELLREERARTERLEIALHIENEEPNEIN